MPTHNSLPKSNLLLAALTTSGLRLLQSDFETIELKLGEVLSPAGAPLQDAYFPLKGMISLVHAYGNGSTMEVGLIGREGFWGTSAVLGVLSSPLEAMVQGKGEALRLPIKSLLAATSASPELRNQLLRYAHFLHVQTAITAACNGSHKLEQRLLRWLLEAHDRLGGETVQVTHEFLSYMLGVRRQGITETLAILTKQGHIAITRGGIAIRNREEIESKACECYGIVKEEYRHVVVP